MKMKLKNLILGVLMFAGVEADAHDFTATVNGQRLFFEITNKTKKTAAVTFNGSIVDKKTLEISGIVEIPSKIKHNNVIYEVNAIGQKAFAHANKLKGIVIPSGVETIGDFAFEGCDSLMSIVFPGNPVSLGQGVFFKCPMISDVTIGSDWRTIDLTMFRWSEKLTSINIPAKIEKIQGMKKLVNLSQIIVDSNNKNFTSDKGMLYSKDGTTFYACPRAYNDKVVIKEGVIKILPGALIDCVNITSIDLPSTIQSISFRETSRMKKLESIILRTEKSITTAYANNDGKFLFQIANPATIFVIKSTAKDSFYASLADVAGDYSESLGNVPYVVTQPELPTKKNFKSVKNFNKY